MIEADNLSKQFDDFAAVSDLSLAVGGGELLALLGPNGAGKTTTVRMLSAILRPTRGTARVNGHDVARAPEQVRRSVGLLTEHPGLYARMSGLEYLSFYGQLYGLSRPAIRERALRLYERFGMRGEANRRLGDYSKGMRQKVGLIRAMLHDPAVLLLDEPTSAMDPLSARLVREAIATVRADRRAVILCTHNLAEAEELADRIAIISRGRLVALGTPEALKQQLLGKPLFEVLLDRAVDRDLGVMAAAEELDRLAGAIGVTLMPTSADRLRVQASDPIRDNPRLIAGLQGLGLGVVALCPVAQSLEEVYLRAVGEPEDAN